TPHQAALLATLRACFFGGFGPGSSKRNCVRSIMGWAWINPFRRQWPMVSAVLRCPQMSGISFFKLPNAPFQIVALSLCSGDHRLWILAVSIDAQKLVDLR